RRHAEAVQPTPSPPPAAKPVGWPPHFLLPVLVAAAILLVGEDRWVVPLLPAGSRSGLARHRAPAPRSFGPRPHAIPSTPHNAQRETTLNGNSWRPAVGVVGAARTATQGGSSAP